jgi:hypothetical protein
MIAMETMDILPSALIVPSSLLGLYRNMTTDVQRYGIVVLWNAKTLARLVIAPYHRLPITGLIDDGRNWLVPDLTGVLMMYDQLFADCVNKYNLAGSLTHLFQHGPIS